MASKKLYRRAGAIALLFLLVIALVVLYQASAITKVSEAKNEEYVGDKIIVRGQVEEVVKIGELSGYMIKDETDSIAVSSNELPVEGEMRTVKGILMRDTLFGYYIRSD